MPTLVPSSSHAMLAQTKRVKRASSSFLRVEHIGASATAPWQLWASSTSSVLPFSQVRCSSFDLCQFPLFFSFIAAAFPGVVLQSVAGAVSSGVVVSLSPIVWTR
eukprot:1159207-Pelagomonas_calceolata.AAC.12